MTTEIVEYNATRTALAALNQTYKGIIFDVSTAKGMDEAKNARADIKRYRTELEKKRKEIKEPALNRCVLIDSEARRIKEELESLEKPIDDQIKKEENRKEEIRLEKLKLEQERIVKIKEKILFIEKIPLKSIEYNADKLKDIIRKLEDMQIDDNNYQEFLDEATQTRNISMLTLNNMLSKAVSAEEAIVRQRDAEEALRREREESERKQKEAEEVLRAEREAAENKQKEAEELLRAEREQAKNQQREAEEAMRAEREEIERRERAAQEAIEHAQRNSEALQKEREKMDLKNAKDNLPICDEDIAILIGAPYISEEEITDTEILNFLENKKLDIICGIDCFTLCTIGHHNYETNNYEITKEFSTGETIRECVINYLNNNVNE